MNKTQRISEMDEHCHDHHGCPDRPDNLQDLVIPLPVEIEDQVYQREFYDDEP